MDQVSGSGRVVDMLNGASSLVGLPLLYGALFVGATLSAALFIFALVQGVLLRGSRTAQLGGRHVQSSAAEKSAVLESIAARWTLLVHRLSLSKLFDRYLDGVTRLFSGITRSYVVSHELYVKDCQKNSKQYRVEHALIALMSALVFGLFFLFQGVGIGLMLAVTGWLFGFLLPYYDAKRKAERYRTKCVSQLPDAIELIALVVETGASINQALELYAVSYDGLLALELRDTYESWKSGALARQEALSRLAIRLDSDTFSRFVTTLVQAVELGVPVGHALSEQAQAARDDKKTQIETVIAKAPVRMMIPMAVCILPAMLLLLLGPIVLQVGEGFGG